MVSVLYTCPRTKSPLPVPFLIFPPPAEVRMTAAHHATYSPLPPAILPRGLMAAASTPRSKRGAIGVAAALRLTDFVRGVLGARGDRAAAAAIETRLQRRVVHLENVSAQTEAQSAGARAARAGGRVKQGLSGKQCKRKVRITRPCQRGWLKPIGSCSSFAVQ